MLRASKYIVLREHYWKLGYDADKTAHYIRKAEGTCEVTTEDFAEYMYVKAAEKKYEEPYVPEDNSSKRRPCKRERAFIMILPPKGGLYEHISTSEQAQANLNKTKSDENANLTKLKVRFRTNDDVLGSNDDDLNEDDKDSITGSDDEREESGEESEEGSGEKLEDESEEELGEESEEESWEKSKEKSGEESANAIDGSADSNDEDEKDRDEKESNSGDQNENKSESTQEANSENDDEQEESGEESEKDESASFSDDSLDSNDELDEDEGLTDSTSDEDEENEPDANFEHDDEHEESEKNESDDDDDDQVPKSIVPNRFYQSSWAYQIDDYQWDQVSNRVSGAADLSNSYDYTLPFNTNQFTQNETENFNANIYVPAKSVNLSNDVLRDIVCHYFSRFEMESQLKLVNRQFRDLVQECNYTGPYLKLDLKYGQDVRFFHKPTNSVNKQIRESEIVFSIDEFSRHIHELHRPFLAIQSAYIYAMPDNNNKKFDSTEFEHKKKIYLSVLRAIIDMSKSEKIDLDLKLGLQQDRNLINGVLDEFSTRIGCIKVSSNVDWNNWSFFKRFTVKQSPFVHLQLRIVGRSQNYDPLMDYIFKTARETDCHIRLKQDFNNFVGLNGICETADKFKKHFQSLEKFEHNFKFEYGLLPYKFQVDAELLAVNRRVGRALKMAKTDVYFMIWSEKFDVELESSSQFAHTEEVRALHIPRVIYNNGTFAYYDFFSSLLVYSDFFLFLLIFLVFQISFEDILK